MSNLHKKQSASMLQLEQCYGADRWWADGAVNSGGSALHHMAQHCTWHNIAHMYNNTWFNM